MSLPFTKMSGKLIVHRFGTQDNFQTIQILVEENDRATFGSWCAGINEKKKDKEKPRLIVKVASEIDSNNIDLDSCAKKVDSENMLNIVQEDFKFYHTSGEISTMPDLKNLNFNCDAELLTKQYRTGEPNENIQKSITKALFTNNKDYIKNPLEFSLERVKENNARIMENIHMLNRTLNYTKKKEILSIINPKLIRSYPCEECGKCFVYETGLRRHYFVRHANLDTQPRWQFVWTCTECFQVWPRQDLALQHASQCCKTDNIDYIRGMKTSSLLQCEFCEKVFTSIPRLLKHLKTHNVLKNYECNACSSAFSCYKSAEQHWVMCLWLKTYYQFFLPKLLLCSACDKKFRNYDQLYNHRYKAGHFIPKSSETSDNNCVNMSILVFQCEICGQWFNAISQIQEHRKQYHAHFNNGIQYTSDTPVTSEP